MQPPTLDAKDYAILRELDINFRQPFSRIGKKVNLSKNSVALRFKKLEPYMLHNLTGIDNETLGYTLVKIFYTFDFFNEEIEKKIAFELEKYKNMIWGARFYGLYDLCVGLLVNHLDDLIDQVGKFNERFASKINQKEMQIIHKQWFFRHDYLHKTPTHYLYTVLKTAKKVSLTEGEKKIINIIRHNPRMSAVEIARRTRLTPKTILMRIKSLEKRKVITGYFMTLDPTKFNFNTFKLLLQVQNLKNEQEFESYLKSIKNVRYITKMLGLWDYEIDCVYQSITDLQKQIELMKEKFPRALKKIEILSFGKRIVTNKENFLA